MNLDAWEAAIDGYVAEVNRNTGETKPTPLKPTGTYTFPIAYRFITEDVIRLFASAIGDSNPLWHSCEYAQTTTWRGMIGPPVFESCVGELPAMPNPPHVPGWNAYNGGNLRRYYKPMRPGDEIRAEDTWLGIVEKAKLDRPYRLFLLTAERAYINQQNEVVCTMLGRMICTATPPGSQDDGSADPFIGRKRVQFGKDELDALHAEYEDELSGRFRRGSEPRYWEDVSEGDEIRSVVKGPYDVTDAVSFFGAVGYSAAFAIKWQGLKSDLARCPVDPETGEYHHVADWHLQDSIARLSGLPYAQAFGTHMETMLSHAVTNWMGDDGFVTKLDSQLRTPLFHGEMSRTYGRVARKYVENGEPLVDLDLWAETHGGVRYSQAAATVRLPTRRTESIRRAEGGG
jgi:acyl dehydratase